MSWFYGPLLQGAAQIASGESRVTAAGSATASFAGAAVTEGVGASSGSGTLSFVAENTWTNARVSALSAEVFYTAASSVTDARVSAIGAEVFYTAYTEAHISGVFVEVLRSTLGYLSISCSIAGTSTATFGGEGVVAGDLSSDGLATVDFVGSYIATISGDFALAGTGATSFVGEGITDGLWSASGVATGSFVGEWDFAGALSSAGTGATSFTGSPVLSGDFTISGAGALAFQSDQGATGEGVFSSDGVAATSFVGVALFPGVFSSDGAATVSGVGEATTAGALASSGAATTDFAGISTADSTFSSAGVAATSFAGQASVDGAFAIDGQAATAFAGRATAAGTFSSDGVAEALLAGESTADAASSVTGAATVSFAGESTAETAFAIDGSAALSGEGRLLLSGAGDATGSATTNFTGASTFAGDFASAGTGEFLGVGLGITRGAFSSTSVSVFDAQAGMDFTSAGTATTSFVPGSFAETGAFSMSGSATAIFDASNIPVAVMLASGQSSAGFVGVNATIGTVKKGKLRAEDAIATALFQSAQIRDGVFNSNGVGELRADVNLTFASVWFDESSTALFQAYSEAVISADWTATGFATVDFVNEDIGVVVEGSFSSFASAQLVAVGVGFSGSYFESNGAGSATFAGGARIPTDILSEGQATATFDGYAIGSGELVSNGNGLLIAEAGFEMRASGSATTNFVAATFKEVQATLNGSSIVVFSSTADSYFTSAGSAACTFTSNDLQPDAIVDVRLFNRSENDISLLRPAVELELYPRVDETLALRTRVDLTTVQIAED